MEILKIWGHVFGFFSSANVLASENRKAMLLLLYKPNFTTYSQPSTHLWFSLKKKSFLSQPFLDSEFLYTFALCQNLSLNW